MEGTGAPRAHWRCSEDAVVGQERLNKSCRRVALGDGRTCLMHKTANISAARDCANIERNIDPTPPPPLPPFCSAMPGYVRGQWHVSPFGCASLPGPSASRRGISADVVNCADPGQSAHPWPLPRISHRLSFALLRHRARVVCTHLLKTRRSCSAFGRGHGLWDAELCAACDILYRTCAPFGEGNKASSRLSLRYDDNGSAFDGATALERRHSH